MDALSIFVHFTTRDGRDTGVALQNFFAEATKRYEGRDYAWSGFGYSGSSVNLEAASVEATLVFLVNELALQTLRTATTDEWLAYVDTVWLDPDTLATTSDRLREVYTCIGMANDHRELVLRLGSPLDAQSAELPARVLSRKLVGNLPATGSVPLR